MWLRFKAAIALAKRGASFSSFSRFLAQREATPKVARSPLLALRETFGEAKRAKRGKRHLWLREATSFVSRSGGSDTFGEEKRDEGDALLLAVIRAHSRSEKPASRSARDLW
jgi:hypothetical protein